MYYVKAKLNKETEIRVEIHGDDIYTECMECGKEILVDTAILLELLEEGNLDGTGICCEKCSKVIKKEDDLAEYEIAEKVGNGEEYKAEKIERKKVKTNEKD